MSSGGEPNAAFEKRSDAGAAAAGDGASAAEEEKGEEGSRGACHTPATHSRGPSLRQAGVDDVGACTCTSTEESAMSAAACERAQGGTLDGWMVVVVVGEGRR